MYNVSLISFTRNDQEKGYFYQYQHFNFKFLSNYTSNNRIIKLDQDSIWWVKYNNGASSAIQYALNKPIRDLLYDSYCHLIYNEQITLWCPKIVLFDHLLADILYCIKIQISKILIHENNRLKLFHSDNDVNFLRTYNLKSNI